MLAQIVLVFAAFFASLAPSALADLAERSAEGWRGALASVLAPAEAEPRAAVQVELLADPDGAERLADDLRRRLAASSSGQALPVFVEAVEPRSQAGDLPPGFRVGVGPFSSFEEAERARMTLEQEGVRAFVREIDPLVGC